jgi:hypothetical protein
VEIISPLQRGIREHEPSADPYCSGTATRGRGGSPDAPMSLPVGVTQRCVSR